MCLETGVAVSLHLRYYTILSFYCFAKQLMVEGWVWDKMGGEVYGNGHCKRKLNEMGVVESIAIQMKKTVTQLTIKLPQLSDQTATVHIGYGTE